MNLTIWIVAAFVLGVLFGRLSARGAAGSRGGPTGLGSFDEADRPGKVRGAGSRPGAGIAPGAVAGSFVPSSGSPDGLYRIMLLDSGPNKINTIKVIRDVTRLDLRGSKDMADSAPRELLRVNSREEAEAVVLAFRGVASVRVDGPDAGAASAGYGYGSANSGTGAS